MFVVKKPTRNPEYFRIQIVENVRENGKVKQKILRNIGTAHNEEEIKQLQKIAYASIEYEIAKKHRCELLLKYGDNLGDLAKIDDEIVKFNSKSLKEEKRIHEGIDTVYGNLFDELGFSEIMENSESSKLLKEIVVTRILTPQSKLKTSEILEKDCNKPISVDRIYRLMDKLCEREENLLSITFQATQKLFKDKIDVLFFDVTTLYFESTEEDEELKGFGFSKDHKFNQVQVVLALATTQEGLPIGYKLFRGNTAETKTLILCLNEWKKNIQIENVIFVADRAMFSKENIYELEKSGYSYIIAAKLRIMDKLKQQEILNQNGYKVTEFKNDLIWTKELEYQTCYTSSNLSANKKMEKTKSISRLICTYSSKRAKKDENDREKMLNKINKYLSKKTKTAPTQKLVTNACLKKFCIYQGKSYASLDENKIENDKKWDGMHGVITNSNKSISEILNRYKDLWQIEESFRISKTNLKVRPIYHYKPSRIRAHISICFLSLCLLRHLQVRLKRANLPFSLQRVQEELTRVQYSICKDYSTGLKLKIPSAINPIAQQIYSALGIKRNQNVTIYKS